MLEKYHVASEENAQAVLKYNWNSNVLIVGGPRRNAEFVRDVSKVFGLGTFTITHHGNAVVTLSLEISSFWAKLEEVKLYWTTTRIEKIGRMLN